MTTKYKVLPHQTMEDSAKVERRMVKRYTKVNIDDPATRVMTDLKEITPYCIEPSSTIDAANNKMIACGVRLLFVTEQNGDLAGIITATDILGEKPVKFVTARGGSRRDVTTLDVMTTKDQLEVIRIQDIETASVGDVIETMKLNGRQHTLVVESNDQGRELIRGIFSTTQIERQTGIEIKPTLRVNTFAEVEKVVMSG